MDNKTKITLREVLPVCEICDDTIVHLTIHTVSAVVEIDIVKSEASNVLSEKILNSRVSVISPYRRINDTSSLEITVRADDKEEVKEEVKENE